MKGKRKVLDFFPITTSKAVFMDGTDITLHDEMNIVNKNTLSFLNIKNSGAIPDTDVDSSEYFVESDGYIVNGGTYKVNNEIIKNLNENNFIGNGKLKNKDCVLGYIDTAKYYRWSELDFITDSSLIRDKIYSDMILESEWIPTRQISTKNGFPAYKLKTGNGSFKPIGAIYKVGAGSFTNITICIGKLRLFGLRNGGGWEILSENGEDIEIGKYEIPWLPEIGHNFDKSQIKRFQNHIEITVSDKDFEPVSPDKTESVIHFWGKGYSFSNILEWEAMIVSCEFWLKDSNESNMFVIENGFDIYDNNKNIKQGLLSRNKYINKNKRELWSHTMDYNQYKSLMDYNFISTKQIEDVVPIIKDLSQIDKLKPNENILSNLLIERNNMNFYMSSDVNRFESYILLNDRKKIQLPYNNNIDNGYVKFVTVKKTGGITLRAEIMTQNGEYMDFIIFINDTTVKFHSINSKTPITKILIAKIDNGLTSIYCKVPRYTQMCMNLEVVFANDIYEIEKIELDTELLYKLMRATEFENKIVEYSSIEGNKVESE